MKVKPRIAHNRLDKNLRRYLFGFLLGFLPYGLFSVTPLMWEWWAFCICLGLTHVMAVDQEIADIVKEKDI